MAYSTGNSDDGYGRLAQLLAQSHEYAIFRKFEWLNMMNLLRLQAELQHMEQQLVEVRAEDKDPDDDSEVRRSYGINFKAMRDNAEDGDSEQYDLLLEISPKLDEYSMTVVVFIPPVILSMFVADFVQTKHCKTSHSCTRLFNRLRLK